MEDLLVVILQLIFEVLLQVLAELPWDVFLWSNPTAPTRKPGSWIWGVLSFVAGAGIGGASLLVFPTTLLHWGGARMANLIIAPTASGFVSLYFSRSKTGRNSDQSAMKIHAACAACFTLGLAIIRFTYAARPGK